MADEEIKTPEQEYEEPSLVDLEDVAGGMAEGTPTCDTGGSAGCPGTCDTGGSALVDAAE